MKSARNADVSSPVNRRSRSRISTRSFRPRSRARGNGGSARVEMTMCSRVGRCSNMNEIASWMAGASMTW